MTKESKKGQKIGVLILYVIVLLGLLAGFLLPMDLFTGAETISFNSALCMQIPDALSKVLGTLGISVSWLDGVGAPLAISAEMSLGEIATIDFNAWLTIIYAVVTVVAVICIIPAIVGAVTRHTKQEKAAAKADSAAADAKSAADAAAAAAGYVQDSNSNWKNPFGQYTSKDEDGNPIPMDENAQAFAADADGNLVIPALEENPDEKKAALYNYATAYAAARTATAAAKTADAAAAEALENKKQKRETTYHTAFTLEVIAAVVLLLMCFFTIMYMEYNDGEPCVPVLIALGVVVIIGFIQRCIASGGSGVAKFILFLLAFIAVLVAFFNISLLLEEETAANFEDLLGSAGLAVGVTGAAGFEYLGYFLFGAGTTPALFEEGISATMMVFEIGGIITAVMVLANCLLDMLGIYKSTNKFMLVADQVIYLLEIVGIILMLVPAIIDEEIGVGMMFIVLIVLVVASYIIDLVRLIMRNKKDKAAKAVAEGEAVPEGNTEAPVDAFGNSAAQPAADYAASGYQAAPVDENPFGDLPLIPAEPAAAPADTYAPAADTVPAAVSADTFAPAAVPAAEAVPAAAPADTYAPAYAPAPSVVNETYIPPVPVVSAPAQETAPATPAAAPAVAPVIPVVSAPAAPQAPAHPVVQPVVNTSYTYNVHALYSGPSDNFIKKLSNDEKVEFARVFLERLDAPLTVIPEYKVGGDNTKFFSNVIIYYARVRDMISDGLMNKLYEEAKVM